MTDNFIPQQHETDVNTFANFDDFKQTHISLQANINFTEQKIHFTTTITFTVLNPNQQTLVLDSNKINILSVQSSDLTNLTYSIYDKHPLSDALGTPLIIHFDKPTKPSINITIVSETTPQSPSLKFLTKEQTFTKKLPFLFTQCEPILCRSLFPSQDSPGLKVTADTTITAPIGFTSLFSGIQIGEPIISEDKQTTSTSFEQKIPMPTYLFAFAVGELENKALSPRCQVWTEVGLSDKAAYDFEKTEHFLSIAENYLCPYEWGRYDILVLPAAFPYGGMENPCLTFVTPSLLAGDQSLANVIAHELSHSWTGNLVTNKNWKNFWMNEGFTTFLERKIGEIAFGEEFSILEKQIGQNGLNQVIESFGKEHNFTSLSPDFSKCDPDDGFSKIPYEKGFSFLEYLEGLAGKDVFMQVMKKYINDFKYKAVTWEDFRTVFNAVVADKEIKDKIEWEKWITTPGFPVVMKNYNSKLIKLTEELCNRFLNAEIKADEGEKVRNEFKGWHTNQKIVFLDYILAHADKVNDTVYEMLRDVLQLNDYKIYNSEVKFTWYSICLKTKHSDCIDDLKMFLQSYGRMKFINPLYKRWFMLNKEEALTFFNANKYLYHPVAVRIIEMFFEQNK
jgi:leukotriene-A4 hydrolase